MSRKRKGNSVNATGRAKYDGQQYLLLPYKLLRSPQFRGLNGNEVRVLIELASRHNGFNNGKIAVGMTDLAQMLHMSKSTVQRALEGLQMFGFIKCRKPGQFMGRLASEWEVTFLKSDGLKPSNEWSQKKARNHKRKKKPKTLAEDLRDCSELKELRRQKIEERYLIETEGGE